MIKQDVSDLKTNIQQLKYLLDHNFLLFNKNHSK